MKCLERNFRGRICKILWQNRGGRGGVVKDDNQGFCLMTGGLAEPRSPGKLAGGTWPAELHGLRRGGNSATR